MQALAFLGLQALVGLGVLLQFNGFTIATGIASLGAYLIVDQDRRLAISRLEGVGRVDERDGRRRLDHIGIADDPPCFPENSGRRLPRRSQLHHQDEAVAAERPSLVQVLGAVANGANDHGQVGARRPAFLVRCRRARRAQAGSST